LCEIECDNRIPLHHNIIDTVAFHGRRSLNGRNAQAEKPGDEQDQEGAKSGNGPNHPGRIPKTGSNVNAMTPIKQNLRHGGIVGRNAWRRC
jgi:hypothetical protein